MQLYRHVLLLTGEHELDLQSRPPSTTIQEPAGISLELFIRCHLLSKDPFPVPPFNVIMIMREFPRGIWIASLEVGWAHSSTLSSRVA